MKNERNYFVSFTVTSTFCNAFITLTESITNNEVHAICFPNFTGVESIKIDGIEYQIKRNFGNEGDDIINMETNRKVKSKEKLEYLKTIANSIIAKGNEYLNNTFGNIEKKIIELF